MIHLISLLYAFCITPCIHGHGRVYHFVNLTLNWTEAQQYCREHYTDLVSVTSLEEANSLNRPSTYTGYAWIGLFDDPASWKGVMGTDSNSWRWSATGTTSTSQYQNWMSNKPNGEDKCVSTGASGLWFDHYCNHGHVFVCYTTGYKKLYYFDNTISLTWAGAMAYCRQHYTDLAVIESSSENDQVTSLISPTGSYYAWMGLYREPWRWSDNTTTNFTNWGGRSYYVHCVAENAAHLWYTQSCDQRLPFFCYEVVRKRSSLVRIHFRSGLDMVDPNNYRMIQQQVEERLNKMGLTGISVTSKSPPIKQKTLL